MALPIDVRDLPASTGEEENRGAFAPDLEREGVDETEFSLPVLDREQGIACEDRHQIHEVASAERALAKGINNALMRAVALRIAARYGASAAVALTGWGTLLLGLAMLFEVGAVAMTPSEMETWVSRSKFGKASKKKFANWEEEEAAMLALFAKPKDAPRGDTRSAPGPAAAVGAPSA